MTISRGVDWGTPGVVPADVIVCDGDASLALALSRGRDAVVTAGDMAITVGCSTGPVVGAIARRLPVDLLEVDIVTDDGVRNMVASSHVSIRGAFLRGGRLRGEVHWIMNAQHHGGRDLVPRGHPNDGRFEVLSVDSRMGPRQRLIAWRRARTGGHLPHPSLKVRSTTDVEIDSRGSIIVIDGVRVGRADAVRVRVRADAGAIWI